MIELSTALLDNENIWVSSNAALVIARISIEEVGCQKLLDLAESCSLKILEKLVDALGCDNAGISSKSRLFIPTYAGIANKKYI